MDLLFPDNFFAGQPSIRPPVDIMQPLCCISTFFPHTGEQGVKGGHNDQRQKSGHHKPENHHNSHGPPHLARLTHPGNRQMTKIEGYASHHGDKPQDRGN